MRSGAPVLRKERERVGIRVSVARSGVFRGKMVTGGWAINREVGSQIGLCACCRRAGLKVKLFFASFIYTSETKRET